MVDGAFNGLNGGEANGVKQPSGVAPARETGRGTYTVIVEAADSGFVAWCPSLPAIAVQAATVDGAVTVASAAIRSYIESLRKRELHLPRECVVAVTEVEIDLERA